MYLVKIYLCWEIRVSPVITIKLVHGFSPCYTAHATSQHFFNFGNSWTNIVKSTMKYSSIISNLTDVVWVCGPDQPSKKQNFTQSLGILWDERICKENLFTILISWDIAVCLRFREKFKIAAQRPKMLLVKLSFFVYICDYGQIHLPHL